MSSSTTPKKWNEVKYDENPYDVSVDDGKDVHSPMMTSALDNVPPWLADDAEQNTNSNNKKSTYTPPVFSSLLGSAMGGSSSDNNQNNSGGNGSSSSSSSSSSNKSGSGDNNSIDNAETAVPRLMMYTRVINLLLSIMMIVVSLLSLLTTQTATTGVLSCYVIVFSCLLCCFETHLKQVSKAIALNFGFMYSAKSRSIFMIFMATILFSFSLFGQIMGLCMIANAIFNWYILCKYPQFDDLQRNDAQSEIKDFLAKNPAFAQNITALGLSAGAEVARNNPQVVQQGAEAYFSSGRNSDGKGTYNNV